MSLPPSLPPTHAPTLPPHLPHSLPPSLSRIFEHVGGPRLWRLSLAEYAEAARRGENLDLQSTRALARAHTYTHTHTQEDVDYYLQSNQVLWMGGGALDGREGRGRGPATRRRRKRCGVRSDDADSRPWRGGEARGRGGGDARGPSTPAWPHSFNRKTLSSLDLSSLDSLLKAPVSIVTG